MENESKESKESRWGLPGPLRIDESLTILGCGSLHKSFPDSFVVMPSAHIPLYASVESLQWEAAVAYFAKTEARLAGGWHVCYT